MRVSSFGHAQRPAGWGASHHRRQGEIARLGAVTAALSAGEPLRALQLAARFLAENLAPEVAEKLRRLVKEADVELARVATDEPTVMPTT